MPERLPTPVFCVVVALAAALPATVALHPAVDPDSWWHLAVGRWVVETGAVPATDPFSRLGRDRPTLWAAYSWLYDVGLFETHAAGGLTGLMLLRSAMAAVSAAALLGLAARRLGPTPGGIVGVLAAGVVLMPFARERPWHLTIAFTVLVTAAVTRLRDGERLRPWWLVPVFVLWANVHIQYVLGGLVLGLACLFPGRADRRQVIGLTLGCGLATFVNPYHARLLGVVSDYATQTAALRAVQELAPPEPDMVWAWAAFGLIGWAGVVTARRRPIDPFAVGLLLAGLVLALRMRRDLWFGALAGLAVLGSTNPGQTTRPSRWVLAAAVAGTFAVVRVLHLGGLGPAHDFAAAVAGTYPERAAAAVRDRGLAGPVFNSFDSGGYLIWALPGEPVTIDGRTNLYGSDRVARSMNTWAGGPDWAADPDLVSANLVVALRNVPLTTLLRERPAEWSVAFEDGTAVVFVRRPQ